MCRHCRMDDLWLAWELRLFRLETRALAAGAHVSAEDALRQVRLGVSPKTSHLLSGGHFPLHLY